MRNGAGESCAVRYRHTSLCAELGGRKDNRDGPRLTDGAAGMTFNVDPARNTADGWLTGSSEVSVTATVDLGDSYSISSAKVNTGAGAWGLEGDADYRATSVFRVHQVACSAGQAPHEPPRPSDPSSAGRSGNAAATSAVECTALLVRAGATRHLASAIAWAQQ